MRLSSWCKVTRCHGIYGYMCTGLRGIGAMGSCEGGVLIYAIPTNAPVTIFILLIFAMVAGAFCNSVSDSVSYATVAVVFFFRNYLLHPLS